MSDILTKINNRLNKANSEYNKNKQFINTLASYENKVADFIVSNICQNGKNREAIELLLDELATIDSRIKDLDYKTRTVVIEREKALSNGRTDIVFIIDDKDKIFIENKILATDQKEQIKRYKEASPKSLIYLTRFGHKASERSECGLKAGKDYFLASYYTHIYNWICKLKEKKPTDDVNKFFIWLNSQIHGLPKVYDLILENRFEVESDISVVKKCGDGFRHFVMWQRVIPELQKFAKENNLLFEVSDRFEFKTNNSFIRFIATDGKEIKLSCGACTNNSWSGINVKGSPIEPHNWDFEQLLHFENIINAITQKVKEEIYKI